MAQETFAVCENCKRINRVQLTPEKAPICGACKSALPMHGAVVDTSDSTFQTLVQKSPLTVVVDVWAPWCGPCRAFAPIFEEMSNRYAGKVVFVKLNSEQAPQTAGKLGIRGIPTILVFKNGQEVTRESGLIPREHFAPWLDRFVST
jgi:thioredoxin 2